jgi:hypothetical protein
MFELAHVWIFTVGVLYAVASTIWLLLGTFFKARWTRWSAMDNGDLRRQVKRVLRENENDIFMRVRRSCICATVVGPDGEEEALQYHLLQAYFLTMYIGDIRAIETTHSTTPPVASGLFRPQGDHRRRRSTLHDSQHINHYTLLAQLTRSYAHRRCIVAARIIRDATADKSHRAGNNNYTLPTQLVQSSESTPWTLSQQGWGPF